MLAATRYPRRTFLVWCAGLLAARRSAARSGPTPRRRGYRDLVRPVAIPAAGVARPWSTVRFDARVLGDAGEIALAGMLVRPGEGGDDALRAFCVLCPHEICHVEYHADTTRVRLDAGAPPPGHPLFVCPCHFSAFDPAAGGAAISGPAFRGLYRFALRVEPITHDIVITQVEEDVLALLGAARPEPGARHPADAGPFKEEA